MRDGIDALEDRTKSFTKEVIRLCIELEPLPGLRRVTWQLIDSAGSVGANHRAMRRSRSNREFASKLQIVNEEIDESVFWLEVVDGLYPQSSTRLPDVLKEGLELRSIFARARSTMRQRLNATTAIALCALALTAGIHYAPKAWAYFLTLNL